MKTTLRRVKEGAYSVVAPPVAPRYFAFFELGGGEWLASLYSEAGEWVADRLSASPGISDSPGAGIGLFLSCIVGDPAEVVGDGALVGRSADDTITVWDVENETAYSYTASDGKHVGLVRITGGKLYWWEVLPSNPGPADTLTYTLRGASFDLGDAADVATYTLSGTYPAGTDIGPGISNLRPLQLSQTTMRIKAKDTRFVLVTLATGAVTSDSDSCGAHQQPLRGWPDSAGAAIGPQHGDPRVRSMPLNFTCSSAARWPMPVSGGDGTDPWHMATVSSDHVQSFATSADHTIGLIYGLHKIPDGSQPLWVIEALTTATSGDPIVSTQVHAHPSLEIFPTCLFPMV